MNRACEALSLLMCTLACCLAATGIRNATAAETETEQRCPYFVGGIPANQCNHKDPNVVDPAEQLHDQAKDGLANEPVVDNNEVSDDTAEYIDEDYFDDEDFYGDFADEYQYDETEQIDEVTPVDVESVQTTVDEDMDLRSGHDEIYDDAVYGEGEPSTETVVDEAPVEDEGHLDDVQYDYESDYSYDDYEYDGEYDYDSYKYEGSDEVDGEQQVEPASDESIEDIYDDYSDDYEGNWYDDASDVNQSDYDEYWIESEATADDVEATSNESEQVEEYQPYDYDEYDYEAYDYDSYDYDEYWYDQVEDVTTDVEQHADDEVQQDSPVKNLIEGLHNVSDLSRDAIDYVNLTKQVLSPSLWYQQVVDRIQEAINETAAIRSATNEIDELDADFDFDDDYGFEEWDCFGPDFYPTESDNAPSNGTPVAEANAVALRYDRAVMISVAKILDHAGSSLQHVSKQLSRVAQTDVDVAEVKSNSLEGVEQR